MTAIILAAGFSKRFGGKKLLADIGGKPMVLHIVDLVLSIGFEEILFVYQDEEVRNVLGSRNLKYLCNSRSEEGQSTSIKAAVSQSNENTEGYMFFTGDQPFVDRSSIESMLDAFKGGKGSIIVPRYGGHKGNPVIFSSCWKNELLGIRGDVGGRQIIENNSEHVFFVEIPDIKTGLDIDTREQYDSIKELNLNE